MRFGCYAPTSDATDQNVDGAAWMFLVFKAANDDTKSTLDSALVVRPLFTPGTSVISTFGISDNRAWITAVLVRRDYNCNGFSVEKPAVPRVR
jgi:hypothetical protein